MEEMKIGLGDVQKKLLIPLWDRAIEAGKAKPHFLTKNEGGPKKMNRFSLHGFSAGCDIPQAELVV